MVVGVKGDVGLRGCVVDESEELVVFKAVNACNLGEGIIRDRGGSGRSEWFERCGAGVTGYHDSGNGQEKDYGNNDNDSGLEFGDSHEICGSLEDGGCVEWDSSGGCREVCKGGGKGMRKLREAMCGSEGEGGGIQSFSGFS